MTDRWQRIGALFDRAVDAAPAVRDALLNEAPETEDIKNEVRSLLAAHDAAGEFLETSPLERGTPAFAAGTMVGTYRVIRMIGRGGMGVVYEAEDTRLHRRVALKALPPDVAGDERQRQRLRQEARAAAALQHPGIATVYSLDEIDGDVFISAEYLAGETLRAELERGALGASRTLAAGVEIARALCAAHEGGIVHRDLKPENIIRTDDGTLKILDFGLAQFVTAPPDVTSRSRLTMTGMLAGTPAYMAPEQLLGGAVGFRADHFAFGVLLYELCTGQHPFAAESLPSTVARILAAPPAPLPASAEVPAALWHVIERCLRKDPAERFPTSRDLVDALREPEVPVAGGTPSPRLRWWRFHQFAAALTYWLMVWPVWHVHRSLGRAGLFFFFATLAAVVVAANLRLHLWFSSRVYPEDLPFQRQTVANWIRWADVAFASLLIIAGIALPEASAGWAALLISVGVGAAVAFLFIEPATARAAFRDRAGA